MPSALLFDLGTVIIDIDPARTREAFKELFGQQFNEFIERFPWQELHRQLELGKISQEAFINRIQREAPGAPQAKDIVDAWNATLIGIPAWKIDLLTELRRTYRLFLLSNTDPIHIDWIRAYIRRTFAIDHFDTQLFEQAFYSFTTGLRKPDLAIYQHVLAETGIAPEEFFFIDDLRENIEGAKLAGISGLQFPAPR